MIKFTFYIRNPWAKDSRLKNYFHYHKQISENKGFEVQIYRSNSYNFFKLLLDLSWRGECHAGPSLEIGLWKYNIDIKIYDHRHWDYENGTWEVYDQNNMEEYNDNY